jgi:hypothetical protein
MWTGPIKKHYAKPAAKCTIDSCLFPRQGKIFVYPSLFALELLKWQASPITSNSPPVITFLLQLFHCSCAQLGVEESLSENSMDVDPATDTC